MKSTSHAPERIQVMAAKLRTEAQWRRDEAASHRERINEYLDAARKADEEAVSLLEAAEWLEGKL